MNWICQNQLCLPRCSAQLTTSRLWCFTAPMHVAGQKTREDRLKKNLKPRNLLVIFVLLADLNPFAMPLCCHVVVVLLTRSGCGWHWVQILAPLGVNQWSPSARSSFGLGEFEFAAFFGGGPSRRRGLALHKNSWLLLCHQSTSQLMQTQWSAALSLMICFVDRTPGMGSSKKKWWKEISILEFIIFHFGKQ